MQTFSELFEFHRARYEALNNECLINCQVGPMHSGDVVLNPSTGNIYLIVGVMHNTLTNKVITHAIHVIFLDPKAKGMLSTGLTNITDQKHLLRIIEMPEIRHRAGDIIGRNDDQSGLRFGDKIKISCFERDGETIRIKSDGGDFDYQSYADRLVVVRPSTQYRVYDELLQPDENAASLRHEIRAPVELAGVLDERLPQWLREIDDSLKAKTAHVFCLTGNINDYQSSVSKTGDKLSVVETLCARYFTFKYHLRYSLGKGITFDDRLMELAFREEMSKELLPTPNMSLLGQEMRKQQKTDPLSALIGKTPEKALAFLERVFASSTESAEMHDRKLLVIDFANDIFPATDNPSGEERVSIETIISWARDKRMAEAGHLIVILSPSAAKIHSELRAADSGIKFLRLPKPDAAQRYAVFKRAQVDYNVQPNGTSFETLARITNGLTCVQIDNIAKLAASRNEQLSLEMVRRAKENVLDQEFNGNLKIKLPQFGFENFGGKENLKAYFRKINENLSRGILRRVPMGVLVPGPPGTGKTCFLECFAKESGFTVVELGNLRSMFVGESERISSQVFEALDDLAPVIVIEDEADQSDTSRDAYQGDAGVSSRIRQMTFKFRSAEQRRGRVIWFSLTNRIDLIDEALKRKGRADEIIPFVLPDKTEYASIIGVMFRRHKIGTDIKNALPFVEALARLEYVTGADIEWMVLEADKLASYDNAAHVSAGHLMQAIDSWVSPSDPRQIDRQTILAIEKSSKQLRPINWQELLDKAQEREHQRLTLA